MVQMNSVKMVYDSSGTEALHGVDLDIHDGEFVFLVGPSGSGKTTIIKLLTGEVHAASGEITVNGFDMMRIKRRKLPSCAYPGRHIPGLPPHRQDDGV